MLDRTCLLPSSPLPFLTAYYLHGEGNSRAHAQTTFPPAPSPAWAQGQAGAAREMWNSVRGDTRGLVFFPSPQRGHNRQNRVFSLLRIPLPAFTKITGAAESGKGLRWGASCPALRTPTASRGTPQLLFLLRGARGIYSFAEKLTDLCKDQFPSMHYQRSWRMHLHVEQTPPGTFCSLSGTAQPSTHPVSPRNPFLLEMARVSGSCLAGKQSQWTEDAQTQLSPPRPYNSAIPYPNNPFSS